MISNIMNNKNTEYYYIDSKVIILKFIIQMHMVKIREIDSDQIKIVDMSAISIEPIIEKTIGLTMLDRRCK